MNQRDNTSGLGYWPPYYVNDIIVNYSIDEYYHTTSMLTEAEIAKMKLTRPHGIDPLLQYYDEIDSDQFCSKIFGVVKGATEEKITITKNVEAKLRKIRREAY